MKRLDYVINEGGTERRASYDQIMSILNFLVPPIAQEIEQKMRWDQQPYAYTWKGRKIILKIQGTKAKDSVVSLKD